MAFTPWYKDMVVYHIWPRSFCDGNGDGIGDLYGVLYRLDYIRSLGVDAIWFSPLYPSPNGDWGYDISDYTDIHPDFGNLHVFRRVLDEAHARSMRVFMDLVINHSSDEHPWFIESRKGRDNPYHNYYYWRPGRRSSAGRPLPPNNWTSFFDGDAWEYDSHLDEYYLHLFAKKQPDLNLENPRVREEFKRILRFWLDMGVDGFRIDSVTLIAKDPGLPSVFPWLPSAGGSRHYANRPRVWEYLREFKREVFSQYDCFVVGEGPMTNADTALRYITEGPNQVLDEMIGFSHMDADSFLGDFIPRPFSLPRMKKAFSEWQNKLSGKGWNALYLENHDHARIISRYGSEKYRVESGKMLAAMYMLLKGTPFVYQGQEIGMVNMPLSDLSMYKDVATHNNVRLLSRLLPKKKVLELIQRSSRENARSPVQWYDGPNAGFTTGRPWFYINPNYHEINVAQQLEDPGSLLNFYRKLIAFRKTRPIVLRGDYRERMPRDKHFYVYERRYFDQRLLVICSFTDAQIRFNAPEDVDLSQWTLEFANYDTNFDIGNGYTSRPYELRVYGLNLN